MITHDKAYDRQVMTAQHVGQLTLASCASAQLRNAVKHMNVAGTIILISAMVFANFLLTSLQTCTILF